MCAHLIAPVLYQDSERESLRDALSPSRLPPLLNVRGGGEGGRAVGRYDERAPHMRCGRMQVDAQVGRLAIASLSTPRALGTQKLRDHTGTLRLICVGRRVDGKRFGGEEAVQVV